MKKIYKAKFIEVEVSTIQEQNNTISLMFKTILQRTDKKNR